MSKNLFVKTRDEMRDLALVQAKKLVPGTVLALDGELGSGKTFFTQALAQALGIKEPVTSPTFNILKVYEVLEERDKSLVSKRKSQHGKAQQAIRRLYHIDCYRLRKPEELLELGFEEWLSDREGIIVIEWADKVKAILPKNRIRLQFEVIGEQERKLVMEDI